MIIIVVMNDDIKKLARLLDNNELLLVQKIVLQEI